MNKLTNNSEPIYLGRYKLKTAMSAIAISVTLNTLGFTTFFVGYTLGYKEGFKAEERNNAKIKYDTNTQYLQNTDSISENTESIKKTYYIDDIIEQKLR